MTFTSIVLIVAALVGIVDTLGLSHTHLFGAAACGAGSGCETVMASDFTRVLGIPLSTLGLGFYVMLAGLSWRSLNPALRDESVRWVSILAMVGIAPTLVLLYLQGVVIGAWCPFCLLSAVLIASTLAASVLDRRQRNQLRPLLGPLPGPRVALPMLLGLAAPTWLFFALEHELSSATATTDVSVQSGHVVARVGDRQITLAEMDRAIQLRLCETRSAMRNEWLDVQVLEKAALEKGVDVQQLLQQEISLEPITEQQIDEFYELNKARMPVGVPRERLDPQIRGQLSRDAGQQARDEYIFALRRRFGTDLNPPPAERFAIDTNPRGGPERGPTDAPVTIIVFSDLECSHCASSHRRLDELQHKYPESIRLVFRHFPLDMHRRARYAAEVATCANQQGQFWPLVEILFVNQKQLEPANVREYADGLGLDMTRLDACLQSGAGSAAVNADVAEGDELGIHSTPTFFINGHFVKRLPSDAGIDAMIQRQQQASR